jgi:hypothetical protein
MEKRGLTGRAYFVKYPSRIENLLRPHLLTDQKPYVVVRTVTLAHIDYKNFITDMTAERRFLEVCAPLCRARPDGALACVLVKQRSRKGGVLAVPDALGFVVWAAYLANAERAFE